MPVEFDDLGLRIIGVETKGLKFYDNSLALQAEIYLQADGTLNIEGVSGDGGVSGDSVVDAMYLVLSAHDDLANARVLVAGNGLSQLDSGAGNNYTLSVGAGTGITVGAAGVAVDQTFAPTWSGIHTFTAATAIQDTLTSQSIVPSATDAYDLGTSSKLFRKAYISEIEAFIFAENTISLIGGWLVVPHGQGSLPADLTAIADTCDFGTVMTVDDFVEMRAFG